MKPLMALVCGSVLAALCGCETDKHQMTTAQPGVKPVCAQCYDMAVKYRVSQPPAPFSHTAGQGAPIERGDPKTGYPRRNVDYATVVEQVHQCPECKTDVSLYVEDGVKKIRCATCAPDGVACDLCAPRK